MLEIIPIITLKLSLLVDSWKHLRKFSPEMALKSKQSTTRESSFIRDDRGVKSYDNRDNTRV